MEESIKIPTAIPAEWKEMLKLQRVDPCSYSPLVLAYIGDAVYELVIRTKVISRAACRSAKCIKRVPVW